MSTMFSQLKHLSSRISSCDRFSEISNQVSNASSLSKPKKTEQGLTLMECIVAIAVIALTSAMIGPPLVLAAATRLQNRRAEQASQIAQGEVDRIRTLVTLNQHERQVLPEVTVAANLDAEAAPGGAIDQMQSIDSNCPGVTPYDGDPLPLGQALPIDIDGDCEEDFLMQVFRDETAISESEDDRVDEGRPSRFSMMVRVYAASAGENFGDLETELASLRFTSGRGNQSQRPLAVVKSEMSWSDSDGSLFCYHGDCDN